MCCSNQKFKTIIFSGQLWSYNISDKKLTNKAWGSQNIEWVIPKEDAEGNLEAISQRKKVLGLRQKVSCNFGDKTTFQTRSKMKTRKGCNDANKAQVWLRGPMDTEGWFTITNQANGLLLSAKDNKTYIMAGTVTKNEC